MSDDGLEPYGTAGDQAVRPRRQSLVVGAAVGLLAAGVGIGFGAGWASHISPASTYVSSPAAGGATPPTSGGAHGASFVGASATTISSSNNAFSVPVNGVSGPEMAIAEPGVPSQLTPLGRWTTPDGITVRAFETKFQAAAGATTPQCGPQGFVTVELSDTEAVFQTQLPIFSGGGQDPRVIGSGVWGVAEGAPAAWALVSTGSSASKVTASFAEGTTDEVSPVSGLAVVASHLKSIPNGGLSGSVKVAGTGGSRSIPLGQSTAPFMTPACQPSTPAQTLPTMPAPGAQPADPAAARAAVTKAIGAMYGGVAYPADFQYVQGADAAAQAAQKTASDNNPTAHVGDTVEQIVFTSPTTGAVRYQVLLNGNPVLNDQVSNVVLDGGVWKVTRASACAIFALGGGHC